MKKPLYDVVMLGGGCSARAAVASAPRRWLRCRACYSTRGLSAAARWRRVGLTGFDYADCEFKKAVIKQCSEIIVGLTSDKIPAAARFVVAASSDIDVLVVEENISREYRVAFQQHDIRIYTCNPLAVREVAISRRPSAPSTVAVAMSIRRFSRR